MEIVKVSYDWNIAITRSLKLLSNVTPKLLQTLPGLIYVLSIPCLVQLQCGTTATDFVLCWYSNTHIHYNWYFWRTDCRLSSMAVLVNTRHNEDLLYLPAAEFGWKTLNLSWVCLSSAPKMVKENYDFADNLQNRHCLFLSKEEVEDPHKTQDNNQEDFLLDRNQVDANIF